MNKNEKKRKRKFEWRQKAKDCSYHSSDSDIEEDEVDIIRVRERIKKSKSTAALPTSTQPTATLEITGNREKPNGRKEYRISSKWTPAENVPAELVEAYEKRVEESHTSPKRKPIRRAKADRVTQKPSKESVQSSNLKNFSSANVLVKRGNQTLCEGVRMKSASDADGIVVIEIKAASDADGLEEIPLCEWKECAFCCCINEIPVDGGEIIKVSSDSGGIYYAKILKKPGFFEGQDGLAHRRIYLEPISAPGGASFKEFPIVKIVNNSKNIKYSFIRAKEHDGAKTQFPAGTLVKIGGKKLEKIKALFELEDSQCRGEVIKVREKDPKYHVRLASEESLWVSARDLINDEKVRYCTKKMEQAEAGSNDVLRNKMKAEKQKAELIIQIQKKKEENSKASKEISDKQKEITKLEEEFKRLADSLSSSKTTLKGKQEASIEIEKELQTMRSTLTHLEAEIKTASNKLQHFRLLREELQNEIKTQQTNSKESEVKKEISEICDFTNFQLVASLGSERTQHDFRPLPKEKKALEQRQKRRREPDTPEKPPKRIKPKPSRLQSRPPPIPAKRTREREVAKPPPCKKKRLEFPPPPKNPRKKPPTFLVSSIPSKSYQGFREGSKSSKRTRKIPIPPQIEKTRNKQGLASTKLEKPEVNNNDCKPS